MKKYLYIFSILATLLIGGVIYAAPTVQNFVNIQPFITNTYDNGSATLVWKRIYGQFTDGCLTAVSNLITSTGVACGSGTGSAPAFTPTSYGASTSTTIGFTGGLFSTASSTFSSALRLSSLGQGFTFIGSNGLVSSIASSSVKLSWFNNDSGFITSYVETDPIVKAISGIVKSNGSAISAAANGTDYTLIAATTCGGTDKVSAISAAGVVTCTADQSGAGGSSAYEIATTSGIAVPQLAYFTVTGGRTTLGSVATTTLSGNSQISLSNPVVVLGGSASTLSISTDSIGDTQLAFNTGQNLTTASDVTFNKTTNAYSSSTIYSSFVTASSTNLFLGTGQGALYTGSGQAVKAVATSTITASTGLTYSGTMGALLGGASGNLTVNTSQNIATLSNLSVAGTLNNTSSGVLYSTGTSTPTVTSPITYSGTLGQFIGGVSGTFACATCAVTGTTITVNGTTNQVTSSAGAQDLSANRTWTLSFPSLIINPNASTTFFSNINKAYFGGTATTTIDSTGNVVIPSGSNLTVTGKTDGCATWATGVLNSTGTTCGAGGGTSAFEIATTSDITASGVSYFTKTTGRTTLGSVATSSIASGVGITVTNGSTAFVLGAQPSVACNTASASVFGCLTAAKFSQFDSATTTFGSGYATTTLGTLTFSTTTLVRNGQTIGMNIVPTAGALTFTPTLSGTLDNSGLTNSTISGVALGGTLANLTATDSSLTFSGTYTGATARTIGLNLGNTNTWTVLQNFNYSSSTVYSSFLTASSTNYVGGGLGTCSGANFLQYTSGGFFTCGTPAGSGTVTSVVAGTGFQNQGLNITSSGTLVGAFSTSSLATVSQIPYVTGVGDTTIGVRLGFLSTSTPTVTSPITYSGTLGAFVGGSSGAFGCATCITTDTAFAPSSIITSNASGFLTATGSQLTTGTLLATSTWGVATSTFVGAVGIGTSTPSNNALFSVGTSTYTAFHVNNFTGKVGIGCENSSASRWSFGCGSNINLNPNINLLVQDPSDARLGASVGDKSMILKSGSTGVTGGIYGYDYAAGTPRDIQLEEFGGKVSISSTTPYGLFSINPTGTLGIGVIPMFVIGSSTRTLYKIDDQGRIFQNTIKAPTVGTCGTSPTVYSGSNDNAGMVDIGSGVSTVACTITFSKTWGKEPFCAVTMATSTTAVTISASSTPTTLLVSFSVSRSSNRFVYQCNGNMN